MMRKKVWKKWMTFGMAAVLVLGLGGCKKDSGSDSTKADRKDAAAIKEENQETGNAPQSGDIQKSEKRTEYPLTITTYGSDGKEITTTYEKAPKKVLAVYQGCIETMLSLGLEEHIAAAAGLDNEVPDTLKPAFGKVDYLDEFTPSLETVTMLEPDMIFSWGSLFGETTLQDAAGWLEKGTNIYINTNTRPKTGEKSEARTLQNEYTDILNIGKIFDVQDRAEALVNEMRSTIEQVKKQTAGMSERPSVQIVEFVGDSITNYGASTLGGDMVSQLGASLVNPDAATVGKEDIVTANADVVFVVYMPYAGDDAQQVKNDNLNKILKDEAFASMDAVKNGRVKPIMLSEMYASATRTRDGIKTFAEGLYPDIDMKK